MTLVSASIRFVPMFEGVHWTEDIYVAYVVTLFYYLNKISHSLSQKYSHCNVWQQESEKMLQDGPKQFINL